MKKHNIKENPSKNVKVNKKMSQKEREILRREKLLEENEAKFYEQQFRITGKYPRGYKQKKELQMKKIAEE